LLHSILYDKDGYNKEQVLENAIVLYDAALVRAMMEEGGVTNTIQAQVYFEISEALGKRSRVHESTLALIKAAQLDSKYVHDLGNTAVMLFNDGYMNEALTAAYAAVELDPTNQVFKRNFEALAQEVEKQKVA
jgi:tetratricopeptide (TPR) repeat protein